MIHQSLLQEDRNTLVPGISVVVPVYNAEPTLKELVAELAQVLPTCRDQYEVILVNDGSQDASWDVVSLLSEQYPWVRGINLMRNYGQHNATLCGIRAANYSMTVTMDDDLQHPPSEIPKLLARKEEGFDVVYGRPMTRSHSWWRNLAAIYVKWAMAKLLTIPQIGEVSAFRIFDTRIRNAFAKFQGPRLSLDLLILWGTARFSSVLVEHPPRQAGRSNYSLFSLVDRTLVSLTTFSTRPLRFATLMGFVVTGFGFCALIYVFARYFIHGSLPGFPFLASIICIFGGAQLFTTGIIGEYLGRTYQRSLDAPTYVVEDKTRIGRRESIQEEASTETASSGKPVS